MRDVRQAWSQDDLQIDQSRKHRQWRSKERPLGARGQVRSDLNVKKAGKSSNQRTISCIRLSEERICKCS